LNISTLLGEKEKNHKANTDNQNTNTYCLRNLHENLTQSIHRILQLQIYQIITLHFSCTNREVNGLDGLITL